MKKFIITALLLFTQIAFSAEIENKLLSEIIADIENYTNKSVVLNLKLKYIDRIFEKIVFYDSENIDIEFDISGKDKRKELSKCLVNIHEGMIYRITFTVVGSGNLGGLTGDLHEFTPVIADLIPVEDVKIKKAE